VVADWASTHRIAEKGVAIFREIGDRMRWHTCHSHIGYAWLHQGRFDLAGANAREAVVALGPEELLQSRLWSLSAVLACDLAGPARPGLIAGTRRAAGAGRPTPTSSSSAGSSRRHSSGRATTTRRSPRARRRAARRPVPAAIVPYDARHRGAAEV
jgi:hypothetical protein